MDTIYYTANFRTIKVAGGEDRVRVYLVPETGAKGIGRIGPSFGGAERPAGQSKDRPGAGQIVDLARARARAERKKAWKVLVETAFG